VDDILIKNHTKIESIVKELAEDELSPKELSLYALGLDWNKLSIVPYNPLWPIIYKIESKRILNSLSPWLKRIEHIGSTAVPYLSAKPIIDIIGAVSSIESIESQIFNFY
jgi:GrpB-like predicted nucleotidyltransferase (UPF0157 family)